MDKTKIKKILNSIKKGDLAVESALAQLKHLPYEDIGCANVDHHRSLRQGIPEVLYAKDKKLADIKAIAGSMLKTNKNFF